jgi:hypothetical protein
MATLHDAVDSTKRILFFIGIACISVLILYFLVTGIINYIKSQQAPPPPTEEFGDLPNINFPTGATNQQLQYSLDTVTGDLPSDFPSRMLVFKLIPNEPDLNNLKDAKQKVQGANFSGSELRITDTVYRWSDAKALSRTMTMNIVNGSFVYTTNFMTNEAFLNSTESISSTIAVNKAREFFQDLLSFPSDVDDGETNAELFVVTDGKRVKAPNEADTKVVEVNFFQSPIIVDEQEYPIYYPKPNKSPINALVAALNAATVVEAHYAYHGISDTSGEYAIKSVDEAYGELQEGKAYIASYFGTDTDIKIQDVFLAYYIGEGEQEYTMPIYIFRNQSKGFYAYVPAIDDYWNDPVPTVSQEE